MNILQIVTQREAAGAQQHAISMARELRLRGYAVHTLFLYRKRAAYEAEPDTTDALPHPPQRGFRGWKESLHLLRHLWAALRPAAASARPDIVITYSHWSNALVAPLARLAGVGIVIANQTGLPRRTPDTARKLDRLWGKLGLYTFSVANSNTTYRQFVGYPRAYRNRLKLVELGIAPPVPTLVRAAARKALGLPDDARVLAHVGRLAASKNHAVILKAMALMPATTHFVSVGDGELRAELEATTKKLGLAARVHWLGECQGEAVANALAAADIFVFPSLWESFGLAPVEAAALGLPLAVADIPTLRDVMRLPDGTDAAMFFPAQNPSALAALIEILFSNAQLRHGLELASRQLAQKYSLARMTDSYEALITQALEDRDARR